MGDACEQLLAELRAIVQRLSLMSHAPIQGYNYAPSDVGRGERWRVSYTRAPIPHLGLHSGKSGDTQVPRGGVNRQDDWDSGFRQKSAQHFQERMDRLVARDEVTEDALRVLLKDATEALRAWTHSPAAPEDNDPPRDSFVWKCQIADDDRPVVEIRRIYSVSSATIYRYRAKYRGLRSHSVGATG